MPRRRTRKGSKRLTELDVLLRDSWSLPPDKLPDELLLIYQDFEQGKRELSPLAFSHYWRIKQQNGGVLPKVVGGRPRQEHEELLIAIKVAEVIAAQKRAGKRRNVTKACREIGYSPISTIGHVRDIYYKYTSDPDLRRILELALAERALPWTKPEPEAEPTTVRDIPPEFYEAGLAPSQTALSKADYDWWRQEVRNRKELRTPRR